MPLDGAERRKPCEWLGDSLPIAGGNPANVQGTAGEYRADVVRIVAECLAKSSTPPKISLRHR